MYINFFQMRHNLTLCIAVNLITSFAQAEPKYAISMYSTPALPPDFVSLPYTNPDAPQGGEIRLGDVGSFDSLNPHILRGAALATQILEL